MKVAIIGSGDHVAQIGQYLPAQTTLIITDGEKGLGMLAKYYGLRYQIDTLTVWLDDRFGFFAPLIRTMKMIRQADLVVAICGRKHTGLRLSIQYAKLIHKPIKIYHVV